MTGVRADLGENRLRSVVAWSHAIQDIAAGALRIEAKISQDEAGDAFGFEEKAKEDMFWRDQRMTHLASFLDGQRQSLFGAGRVRKVASGFVGAPGPDQFVDAGANGIAIEVPLSEEIH